MIDSLVHGGAERFTAVLSGFLVERGIGTTVVTFHSRERDFFQLPPDVDRVALDLVAGPSPWSKLVTNLGRVRAVRAVLERDGADVVVGMMTDASVVSVLAGGLARTRVLVAERNFPGRKRLRWWWVVMRKLLYRFADGVVAQTRETAAWLRQRAGARDVRVIPNPVVWPLPDSTPVRRPGEFLPADSRCFMAAGSKIEQKGFDLLLEAFASVAGGCAGWHLAVVGVSRDDPRQRPGLDALGRRVEQLGLGDRVHFPGPVGNMSEWYEAADVFVLSSRYEGFPNVLLEAMAAGRPCIAFDCDTGPRDLITHDVNGLLVAREDPAALGEAMARLAGDAQWRERLGKAAAGVRDTLSETGILERWHDLIVDLAGDGRRPAGG